MAAGSFKVMELLKRIRSDRKGLNIELLVKARGDVKAIQKY